ncbi:MAG TPA: hypothetical protein VFH27_00750 [Longimicrobiaceae bacterium]|nr:hypothetical protein [Longimicrobiaceae bacterium]
MCRTRPVPLLLALLLPAAAGCARTPEAEARQNDPPVHITLASGLDSAQAETLYHLAEGSEVLPSAWVRAVKNVATGRLFLEQPERFGLIADPGNPDGLPVGITDATTVDTRLFGVHMTGINCAACHVREIAYGNTRMRVLGAPADFEANLFSSELTASLKATLTDPREFVEFLWRMRREHETASPFLPPAVRGHTGRVVRGIQNLHADADRGVAEAVELLRFTERALAHERDRPADDMLTGLQVAPGGAPAGGGPELPRGLTYRDAAVAADSLVPDDLAAQPGSRLEPDPSGLSPAKRIEAFLSDVVLTYRLMKSRVAGFRRILPSVDTVYAGPGRVDAFGRARNSIYPPSSVPLTAPVDYPWLWGMVDSAGRSVWFHYDGNTNSFMQRNLGQAVGVGAVYDSTTYQSTLNPRAIHTLEMLAEGVKAPVWPVAVLGTPDPAKVALGDSLYRARCLGCHTPNPAGAVFSPDSIGTDRLRLTNFALPMQGGGHFTTTVAPFLDSLAAQAYATFAVPPDTQRIFSHGHAVWQTTGKWVARPLHGVWATAPFLHNGSVPTLYDLLQPAEQRPRTFGVGQREFDPVKVGLAAVPNPPATYRTDLPGNSNRGHEGRQFGTTLTLAQKAALLEYLKKL